MKHLIERVWDYSLNNPEGFTIDIESFKPITKGIAVAYLETQNSHSKESINKVIIHAKNNENTIGGWLEKNLYYFDSVKIFETKDLEKAIEFAKEQKQIAIFNLTTFETIEIKY
jgi:fructokinase